MKTWGTKQRVGEALAAFAFTILGIFLWRHAFRDISTAWFLWDDPWFMDVPPWSLADILLWFTTAIDSNGYYRPFSKLLWSSAIALGAIEIGEFQIVTITLLFGAGVFLSVGLYRLFGNLALALAATAGFLFTGVHVKPLFWTTVWFQTASCFFCAASFMFFVLYHGRRKQWFRYLGMASLFLAYSNNNGVHSWAVVPLAIDFVFIPRMTGELWTRWVKRFLWVAKDHLILSVGLFTFLYVVNHPFNDQSQLKVAVWDFENIKAFVVYAGMAIAHPWGDGPRYTGYPLWLLAAMVLSLGTFLFGFLVDRKLLIGSAAYFAGGVIISLLHGRMQMEYAAPMALATAILYCGLFARVFRGWPRSAWVFATLWLLGVYWVAEYRTVPPLVATFKGDAQVSKALVTSIRGLSSREPPGRVFLLTRVKGERVKSASNAHFLPAAIKYFVPGRVFFLDYKLFHTGENMGALESSRPLSVELLHKAGPPLLVTCSDEGCEEEKGNP